MTRFSTEDIIEINFEVAQESFQVGFFDILNGKKS